MIKIVETFSGFWVDNLEVAKKFYTEALGCEVSDVMGGTNLKMPTGATLSVYQKTDHVPAAYTILNLVVEDISEAVDQLLASGIRLGLYDGFGQYERGIAWGKRVSMGPNIARFKDPAGNVLAVIEQ
ncbi:VOC family protein [Aeromicrobium sp.]|nr:VOC family protein [Candidatus Saccharibacteria bacterium]